ncbi:MAG: MgtC/SapB family protein [Aquihabitans sp.]
MLTNSDLVARLALTLVLCFLIGFEREARQKSAGLRTHTLVGLGAAIAMMVSKYGFADMTDQVGVSLDPSRVAAQIVSGVGFIGAGIIFVRRGSVRGLTTAAVVWMSAMIGMACGAGLYVLAVAGAVAHFLIVLGFRFAEPLATAASPNRPTGVLVTYEDGRGILRDVLGTLTGQGFSVTDIRVNRAPDGPNVQVGLSIEGRSSFTEAVEALMLLNGVVSVDASLITDDP